MGKNQSNIRKVKARAKSATPHNSADLASEQKLSRLHRVPVVRVLMRGGAWARTDVLTAIGIPVAVAAIVTPILIPAAQPDSTSTPDLKVERVEIALANDIDASDQIPGLVTPMPEKDTGSAVDITLRNVGNSPALIVNAALTFTKAIQLYSCPGGAGAGVSTAKYDIKVPVENSMTAGNPLKIHRDMRFIVDANSVDRFRISVGPEQYSSVSWPWIYEFNLSLIEDNGQQLALGPISILGFSPSTGGAISWDPLKGMTKDQISANKQQSCVAHDEAELSRAIANPGLHSPELQIMYREAKALTSGVTK